MQHITNTLKQYLIRALYEWCSDNLLTPYIVSYVNNFTKVPNQYVVEDKILLNISTLACKNLIIDNKFINFYARFNGVEQEILIPIGHIISFYAKENGQGMNFEIDIYIDDASINYDIKNQIDSSSKNFDKPNHFKIVKK